MPITNRRIHGLLRACGLDNCTCLEVAIVEEWTDGGEERTEDVWIGSWCSDPAPSEEAAMLEELADACRKHHMEPDSFDNREFERYL